MSDPEWSLWVHDQITGNPMGRVKGKGDWSISIGGDGQSSVTVVTNDAEEPFEPGYVDYLFTPNARMLVRWWGVNGGAHPDDLPVSAHKIEDYDYDRDAGTVAVSAIDLLDFTEWRLIAGVGSDKSATLTITNRSAEGAVCAAFYQMMNIAPEWALPIDLPADDPGGFSGKWEFWKGPMIADVLKEIRDREGVEIYLEPRATALGGVRLKVLVGAPIVVGGVKFNLDAARSPIAGVHYRKDGKSQNTGLLGVGQGTGEDQHTRWAGGSYIIPIRDTRKTFPDMTGDALQQATTTAFLANRNPVVQWDIGSFTIGDDWTPDMVLPGRLLWLEIHDDPVIPDGVHAVRVISLSGGDGLQLKPEVQ
jgi:hypothetical protein